MIGGEIELQTATTGQTECGICDCSGSTETSQKCYKLGLNTHCECEGVGLIELCVN
jgi:hypothetical protein